MYHAIILAGGIGMRAGGSLPKQFKIIGGKPMLYWSIRSFVTSLPGVSLFIVVHPDYMAFWEDLFSRYGGDSLLGDSECRFVSGGKSRLQSVFNGLKAIDENRRGQTDEDIVLIHDGARPLVSKKVILEAVGSVAKGVGVVPAIDLSDSIRCLEAGGSRAVDRSLYRAVQTPQVFYFNDIFNAYREGDLERPDFTDDASVAESCGIKISLSPGDRNNIKVTNPVDFIVAEALLNK